MKKQLFILIILFHFFISIDTNAQCAMCKSSIESNQKEQVLRAKSRAEGLNTGILYLMVLPYIMFAVIGYFWYKNSKKERDERQKLESAIAKAIHR